MDVEIREYIDTDENDLIALTEELQDYLIDLDPLKRLIRHPDYGAWYTARCLEQVRQKSGKIFIGRIAGKTVAYIAGIIDEESPDIGMGYVQTKAGRITELVVTGSARSSGIGAQLMAKLEAFFLQSGCNIIRVEVFAPNHGAIRFYDKLGYSPRTHDFIKTLT